jgi:hypothetical protein
MISVPTVPTMCSNNESQSMFCNTISRMTTIHFVAKERLNNGLVSDSCAPMCSKKTPVPTVEQCFPAMTLVMQIA